MRVSLYLDEDAQDNDLIDALRLRGVDVVGAWDAGMPQRDDEDHLVLAAAQAARCMGSTSATFIVCIPISSSTADRTRASFLPSNNIIPSANRCAVS